MRTVVLILLLGLMGAERNAFADTSIAKRIAAEFVASDSRVYPGASMSSVLSRWKDQLIALPFKEREKVLSTVFETSGPQFLSSKSEATDFIQLEKKLWAIFPETQDSGQVHLTRFLAGSKINLDQALALESVKFYRWIGEADVNWARVDNGNLGHYARIANEFFTEGETLTKSSFAKAIAFKEYMADHPDSFRQALFGKGPVARTEDLKHLAGAAILAGAYDEYAEIIRVNTDDPSGWKLMKEFAKREVKPEIVRRVLGLAYGIPTKENWGRLTESLILQGEYERGQKLAKFRKEVDLTKRPKPPSSRSLPQYSPGERALIKRNKKREKELAAQRAVEAVREEQIEKVALGLLDSAGNYSDKGATHSFKNALEKNWDKIARLDKEARKEVLLRMFSKWKEVFATDRAKFSDLVRLEQLVTTLVGAREADGSSNFSQLFKQTNLKRDQWPSVRVAIRYGELRAAYEGFDETLSPLTHLSNLSRRVSDLSQDAGEMALVRFEQDKSTAFRRFLRRYGGSFVDARSRMPLATQDTIDQLAYAAERSGAFDEFAEIAHVNRNNPTGFKLLVAYAQMDVEPEDVKDLIARHKTGVEGERRLGRLADYLRRNNDARLADRLLGGSSEEASVAKSSVGNSNGEPARKQGGAKSKPKNCIASKVNAILNKFGRK